MSANYTGIPEWDDAVYKEIVLRKETVSKRRMLPPGILLNPRARIVGQKIQEEVKALFLEMEADLLGRQVWEHAEEIVKHRERPVEESKVPLTWWDAWKHRFIPERMTRLRERINYVTIITKLHTEIHDIKTVHYRMCPHQQIPEDDRFRAIHFAWLAQNGPLPETEDPVCYGLARAKDEELLEELDRRHAWRENGFMPRRRS